MKPHPIQPLEIDSSGVLRFKRNKIVERLLDEGGIDLNAIASWDVPREDREQFAQLIGYSHSGAGDLGFVSSEVLAAAELMHTSGASEDAARATFLRDLLGEVRTGARDAMATLFGVHPDDLKGSP